MTGSLIETRHSEALKALSAYFDSHVEEGEPPCPCEMCEAARKVFMAELKAAKS